LSVGRSEVLVGRRRRDEPGGQQALMSLCSDCRRRLSTSSSWHWQSSHSPHCRRRRL